jgi:SAM-dependent methyltransferase
MEPTTAYSTKAAHYARHRWRYADGAIRALIDDYVPHIGLQAAIADLGAGTGILSQQLLDRCAVQHLYAVEPNAEMRALAHEQLAPYACCAVLDGTAEAIPLPNAVVDLITVAQAIHWFEPVAARAEFRRIARPGCRLALLRNYGTDRTLGQATSALMVEENGILSERATRRPERQPPVFYFCDSPITRTFSFVLYEPWETFLGSLRSASFTPDEKHPLYPRFERAARAVFDRLSLGGLLEVRGETELIVGCV